MSLAQAGLGPGAQALGPGDADVAALCAGVDALLRHRLRPRTPRDGWAAYLPTPARPAHGPWAMLQVFSLPPGPSRSLGGLPCASGRVLSHLVLPNADMHGISQVLIHWWFVPAW